jgi:hypothetical protein
MDSFVETDIPSFSPVMPMQSPTNGAYHPTSTSCYESSASGSVAYSGPSGTTGLPVKHQGMPSTNMFHGADEMRALVVEILTDLSVLCCPIQL